MVVRPVLAVPLTLAKSYGYDIVKIFSYLSPWARLSELAYLPDRTPIMRIYFNSLVLPKKAAKRIKKHFTPQANFGNPMPLNEAHKITAWMLGYDTWHELEQITKSANQSPSSLDEQATPEEQKRRISFQADVLGQVCPVTKPILRQFALQLRVSAGSPYSTEFSEDAFRSNAAFYWEPYGEEPEWRFRPSLRSKEAREFLYELIESWGRGQISMGGYLKQLEPIIERQPENIVPYLYLISACGEIGQWAYTEDYLPRLEAAIENALPEDYPRKKKVPSFIWGTMDNRDFLRSLYYLGVGYYAAKNFKKAKQWFLFLTRCSSITMGHEKYFLKDLRLPVPKGDLHLLEGKGIAERFEPD